MKNNLKVLRAVKNITQAELADRAGVSRQTINAIENQDYQPSVALALKIAKILESKIEDIFELENKDWD